MSPSSRVLDLITSFDGISSSSYRSLVSTELCQSTRWLEQQGLPKLEQHQVDGLCSWAHHAFHGRATAPKQTPNTAALLSHIRIGMMQLAASEFSAWTLSAGKLNRQHVARRQAEARLFLGLP